MYAVIMASGQGTRLWPLSRQKRPKQFHSFIGKNTLIQDTFKRLKAKFPVDQILVAVTKDYFATAREQLPEISADNFIVEPFTNNTVTTCGVALEHIKKRDPKSTVIFLPSDHIITEPEKFVSIVDFAEKMIKKHSDQIILIGINPTKPDTSLGYIQMDDIIEEKSDLKLFSVKNFVEKPDLATAEKYLASWEFLWNAGMFVWNVEHILELYKRHLPKAFVALEKIGKSIGTVTHEKVMESEYKNIENISVDYAITENEKNVMVIPADFGWSDVGSWGTLLDVLKEKYGTKVVTKGNHMSVDDENCMVSASDKLIATVGLKDIVVIDSADALLICNSRESQKVKDLIDKLRDDKKHNYL